jgi:transcriptional regulator with XRE-family HTH domain
MRSVGSAKFEALSYSHAEIASKLGVCVSSIVKWKNGERTPRKDRARIAELFGIDRDDWDKPASEYVRPAPLSVTNERSDEPDGQSLESVAAVNRSSAARFAQLAERTLRDAEREPDAVLRAKIMKECAHMLSIVGKLTGEARELTDAQLARMPAFRRAVESLIPCLCDICLEKVSKIVT